MQERFAEWRGGQPDGQGDGNKTWRHLACAEEGTRFLTSVLRDSLAVITSGHT